MISKPAISVNKTYSEPSSRDNLPRKTESSFNESLRIEELKLKEKNSQISLFPWKDLFNCLSSSPIEFDFAFSSSGIKNITAKENQNSLEANLTENRKNDAVLSDNNSKNQEATAVVENKLSYTIDKNSFMQNLIANTNHGMSNLMMPFELLSINNMKAKPLDLDIIISEISDKIKIVKEGEKTTLSLALKPEDANELLMSLSMKNGIISISFTADDNAREWLEANLIAIEESLKNANVNLGGLEINSGNRNKNQYEELNQTSIAEISLFKNENALDNLIDNFSYQRLFGIYPESFVNSKA